MQSLGVIFFIYIYIKWNAFKVTMPQSTAGKHIAMGSGDVETDVFHIGFVASTWWAPCYINAACCTAEVTAFNSVPPQLQTIVSHSPIYTDLSQDLRCQKSLQPPWTFSVLILACLSVPSKGTLKRPLLKKSFRQSSLRIRKKQRFYYYYYFYMNGFHVK